MVQLLATVFSLSVAIGGVAASPAVRATTLKLPPVALGFDYQLQQGYTPPAGVKVVARDRTDTPAPGLYNLCYINAFQTQPQELSWWKKYHDDLLLKRDDGSYIEDSGYPGEVFLDTRTDAKRKGIAKILNGWIDGCKKKGFDAIDPDNLDSYTREDAPLTLEDNLALAKLLVTHANSIGMPVGQKNTGDIGTKGRDIAGFSFTVVEECARYDECDDYTAVYGNHILAIEYTDEVDDEGNGYKTIFARTCKKYGTKFSIVLRDRYLVPKGDKAYFFQLCPNSPRDGCNSTAKAT